MQDDLIIVNEFCPYWVQQIRLFSAVAPGGTELGFRSGLKICYRRRNRECPVGEPRIPGHVLEFSTCPAFRGQALRLYTTRFNDGFSVAARRVEPASGRS